MSDVLWFELSGDELRKVIDTCRSSKCEGAIFTDQWLRGVISDIRKCRARLTFEGREFQCEEHTSEWHRHTAYRDEAPNLGIQLWWDD